MPQGRRAFRAQVAVLALVAIALPSFTFVDEPGPRAGRGDAEPPPEPATPWT